MRIAYILPDWPEPPHKGYQRIALERIRRLGLRHEVEVFYFKTRGGRHAGAGELHKHCAAVHEIDLMLWRSVLGALNAFVSGEPAQIGYYRSARMRALIDSEHAKRPYDVVIVQLVRLAQFLPKNFAGPALLDMIDPLPISYRRSLEWRSWYTRWFFSREAALLIRYERKVVRDFSSVLLVSANELPEYQELLGYKHIAVVPHGVDTEYFSPSSGPRTPGMIVLTGNLGYTPNVDAVNYFCSEVFPAILASQPEATLWLVGARPSANVRRWADGRRIHVTGVVTDIRDYLRRAMVAVCPVRHRVGTQTKILEAMATGTPVVATEAAMSGLVSESLLRPIRVARSPAEFSAHVISLLRGVDWDESAAASRQYVLRHYSWDSSVGALEGLANSQKSGEHGQRSN